MTGIPPTRGFGLPDGNWLLALAGGGNRSFESGIVARAGGTKAAAIQLPSNVALLELGVVATGGDSALMPEAKAGSVVLVRNAGAASADLFGQGTNTINGVATATAYALANGVSALFFCVVDGDWSAIKSA